MNTKTKPGRHAVLTTMAAMSGALVALPWLTPIMARPSADSQKGIPLAHAQSPSPTNQGIWISREELLSLPTTGTAWQNVKNAADSDWGNACLYDNNCEHDVKTLAGALVAIRLNDAAMRDKVIKGLQDATGSQLARTLELARGLQSYVIAADIIGYEETTFKQWVAQMLETPIQGREGNGLYYNALRDSSNWGGHERASVAAALLYLKDSRMNEVVRAYREFIGETDSPKTLNYKNTNWHADAGSKAGVNRRGAKINDVTVSGILPEDWRRGGEFSWPPRDSGYMWEGMQGYVVTAAILHRAGLVPFQAEDNVVVRAMDILHGEGEAARNNPVYKHLPTGDDTWIPWLVNYYAGTTYPTEVSATTGKGMGWTAWTHASCKKGEKCSDGGSAVATPSASPPTSPNQPPSISVAQEAYQVSIGETVRFAVTAKDQDSASVSLNAANLNEFAGATFE